eukprot:s1576_g5.t1
MDTAAASTATDTAGQAAQNSVDAGGATDATGIRTMYLYSGPSRPDDGLAKFVQELGAECVCVDKEFNNDHDLLNQNFWEECKENFDDYDSFLASPPCSTFTPARRGKGGPQPLRGVQGSDRYGLKSLSQEEKKQVTEGNVLALRSEEMATKAHDAGQWWMIEQPHGREGKTSMWNLDEFIELRNKEDVHLYTFDQCKFGCMAQKRTDLMSNIPGLSEFEQLCDHPLQDWIIPWSGEVVTAPHPPLRGKQWAIPASEWDASMLRDTEPSGDYITRSCAAYPMELNRALARALCRKRKPRPQQVRAQAAQPAMEPTKVNKLIPLRGKQEDRNVDESINSLRDVHRWVTKQARYIGIQVRNIIFQLFDSCPEVEKDILESLGMKSNQDILNATWMQTLRHRVADLLVRNRTGDMPPNCDVNEIDENGYKTCIRGRLLEYWAMTVADPGVKCARWTYEGAPAGLEADTGDLDNYFPQVALEEEGEDSWDLLTTEFETFQNYLGVEDDPEAYETLESYHEKGFLDKFSSIQELETEVGGRPTLSKLGCIKKTKVNVETGETVTKTRIILDCKRSHVSRAARRLHKAVLPRVTDAVQSLLRNMARAPGEVTMLIADITDAFWLIPLRKCERKYFTAMLRGNFYSFNRTAQGSRGAPLTFAAIIATAARWVASADHDMHLQVYVDDPIAILQGSESHRQRMACLVIVMWSLMGFPIATHKARLDTELVWIGVGLQVTPTQVKAEVPEAKVKELDGLLADSLSSNVVSKRSLRTLIGKAMAIASIIYVWRPFISELYTALHAEPSRAPQGCVWTKQIEPAVKWLRTFLAGELAGIQRIYLLDVYTANCPEVTITWDASPYGMGATLQLAGRFLEFFAIPISKEDEVHLSTQAGSHEGQQTWEALCGLICLRLWRKWWQTAKLTLRLRNDNVGALTLYAQTKGRSPAHTLLAREFALDLGQAQYRPAVAEHIPGSVNVICDVLSRRFQPDVEFKLPPQLAQAKAVVPPPRPRVWWKTLSWGDASPAKPSELQMGDATMSPMVKRLRRR